MTACRFASASSPPFSYPPSAAPLHSDERIRSFIIDITIDDAGGLQVTETLDVQAKGQRIRHGIFRPLTKDGIRWGGFDRVDATMDGAPVDTRIQRRDGMTALFGPLLLGPRCG